MPAGKRNKYVSLARTRSDAADPTALTPEFDWVSIEPLPPGGSDDRSISHIVNMRFRADVTIDTRIHYDDPYAGYTRELFVRGLQNVSEANAELNLYCEEVQP